MIIDLIFMVLAAYGFFLGYQKGLIKTLFMGVSVFIGFALTVKFTPFMHAFLIDFFKMENILLPILAFVLTFIVSMITLRMALRILEAMVNDLDAFNKLLGGVLVAGSFLFLYSGILWFLIESGVINIPIDDNEQPIYSESGSMFLPYIDMFLDQFDTLMQGIVKGLSRLWRQMMEMIG